MSRLEGKKTKSMVTPRLPGWWGRAPSCLPCSWALSGTVSPVQGTGPPPAALLCSPCRSSRASSTFASHTMIFTGNVSVWPQPPSPGFPDGPPGVRGQAVTGPVSPAAICPLHPPAALLRVGGGNVINRFGDAPWSLVATHCHPHGQWGCCFTLVLPAGLISTNIYEEMGSEEGLSAEGLGGGAGLGLCKDSPSGLSPSPLPGFPTEGMLAGLARGDHCEKGRQSIPLVGLTLLLPPLVFLEIADEKSRHSLHENMSKIKAPTQVIWGKQDQVRSLLRLPHGTASPSLPVSTRGSMAWALLPDRVLLCVKLAHVCPHPQWVWTRGLGGVMGRKSAWDRREERAEPGLGRARGQAGGRRQRSRRGLGRGIKCQQRELSWQLGRDVLFVGRRRGEARHGARRAGYTGRSERGRRQAAGTQSAL